MTAPPYHGVRRAELTAVVEQTVFENAPIAFGDSTALDVMDRLIDVAGLDMVDVGCGAGDLARALVGRGARVIAIEPDDQQARRNAEAPLLHGLTFRQAAAETLPLASASADGIVFSKSLHHVPVGAMQRAIGEACRVLREDGFLYVLEPDVEGPFSDLMQPFHDETEVRHAALAALECAALPAFADLRRAVFVVSRRYASFEEFVGDVTGLSYNATERDSVETGEVRARFDAGFDGAGYSFAQPMSVYLFSGKIRNG